jgi:hypothetical protein
MRYVTKRIPVKRYIGLPFGGRPEESVKTGAIEASKLTNGSIGPWEREVFNIV